MNPKPRLSRSRPRTGNHQRGEAALPIGALFMVLVLGLAFVGVAYGLWFKILTIEGTVQTGEVHASFTDAFTDDDGKVDEGLKDENDVGDCPIGGRDNSSCDPAASGRDPKPRYEKDVGWCFASIDETDNNRGFVEVRNSYPSYFCTAWFDIVNDGSIPVRVASVTINDVPVRPSVPTPFDLDGDGSHDIELHISEIRQCQQIEPDHEVQMDIDQHVLQPAPQNETLRYFVEVQLNQFNESGCRVLLYHGNGGMSPGDETGPSTDLFALQAHYEAMGFAVDYTDVWPGDLSAYQLVVIYGPGRDNDGGANFFDAAQVGNLNNYMTAGGRAVVMGDFGGAFGVNTVNDLLTKLGVGISQNSDTATPDGDTCGPMNDISADQVTAGISELDPSATSSLNVSGSAISLARVDPAPYACDGGVINGATWMAVDQIAGAPARPGGDVVVIGDLNILDDLFGFGDPQGDGNSGPALATNLVGY